MLKNHLFKSWLLLLCLIVGGVSNSWADTETITLSNGSFSTDHITWSGTSVTVQQLKGSSSTAVNSSYVSAPRVYKGHILSFEAKTGYKIKSISITVDGTYYGNSMTAGTAVSSNTVTDNTTDVSRTWTSTSGGTHVVSAVSDDGLSAIYIQNVASTNVQLRFTSISITYTAAAPAYTITAQSNNENYGTVSLSGSVITGSPKTGYRYATPAYTVAPANSATVEQNGNAFTVTPSANTTVTINFEAIPVYTVTLGDNSSTLTEESAGAGVTLPTRSTLNGYTFAGWSETNVSAETTTAPTIISAGSYAPTANITLYPVYTKTVGGGGTTHESASVTISEYATANSWGSSSSTNQKSITLNSDVTATCNSGTNSGKYYTDWRIYQGETGKVTISTTSGELTSVTFTFTVSNTGTLNYNSSAITSGTAVSVSGTSAEFTVGNSGNATNGQVRITAISVNYDITGAGTTYYWSAPVAAAVETPSIVVAENPFLFSTTATITCATEGAAIKYSYDNSTWNDYSSALTITETKTIYAKATKGEDESYVAQVTATKNLAEPTVTVSGDLTLDLDGETNVEAGTLTAAVTYEEAAVAGASVTWSSSNDAIATINATSGVVTIKTTGEVTFTATYAGNGDYAEATGTKTVTVIDSKVPGSLANPYTVAEALENTPASGTSEKVYIRGYVSKFYNTSIVGDGSNYRYYVSDDGTETNQMLVYRGKGLNEATFTNATDLEIGDLVVIYGGLTTYSSTKEIASGNYLVSRTEKPASDLTKTSDITLDYKNGATEADLTDYFTTSSAGAITYTVADETVIENADELISALKVGTTTVTVSQAATLSYKAGEITINVTVQDTREAATTIPAINIATLKVGNSGTVSVTSPVKADEGVTFSYASSDDDVLLIVDDEYEAVAVGTATVTVTATPSNTKLYKSVTANFEVTVEADVKTDTEITLDQTSGSTVYGNAKSVDFLITDGYNGAMTYSIDNAAIADVEIGADAITFTPKAVGTAVITISAPATATFNAADDVEYTLTVTAPAGGTEAVANVDPITLDFSDNTSWNFPTSNTVSENTYTSGDYSVVLTGSTGNGYKFFDQYSCLLIGKSGATIQLPSFSNVVSQIDVTGHSNASGSVKLNIFEGETAVSTEVTGITSTQNFKIAEANQGANKTYTLKVTSAANAQIKSIAFSFKNVTIQTTLNASGYATFCSQYPLDFSEADGFTAWYVSEADVEKGTITFSKVTGDIKGGEAVFIKGEANATVTIPSKNSTKTLSGNMLVGTLAPTYLTQVDGDYTNYAYSKGENAFMMVKDGSVMPANKAYLPIPAAAGVRFTFVFDDEETTTVQGVAVRKTSAEQYYNINGQRVENPKKGGLYIVDGRKMVIK